MAKKEETTTSMTVEPIAGTVSSPLVIPADEIEEAVVMEEEIDPEKEVSYFLLFHLTLTITLPVGWMKGRTT